MSLDGDTWAWIHRAPLHVRVALALGWTGLHAPGWDEGHACGDILLPDPGRLLWKGRAPGNLLVGPEGCTIVPRFDEDWSVGGPLLDTYGIGLQKRPSAYVRPLELWQADKYDSASEDTLAAYGATALGAVCNLIVALKDAGKL